MEVKPLLEEKEEKIVFASDNKLTVNKKGKQAKNGHLKSIWNKSVILTVILTVVVFYFFGKTTYGFYLGFRYFDLRYATSEPVAVLNNNNKEETNNDVLEEVPLSSAILKNTYNKINLSNCGNLLNKIYSSGVSVSDLTPEEKLELALNYLENKNNVSSDELNKAFLALFNDASLINNYQVIGEINYGNYLVSYDGTNKMFTISVLNNNVCENDFLVKEINRATIENDYLYIYENFGYFKNVGENNYEVYDSPNLESLIMNYTDDGTRNFTNKKDLTTYMWTYKKGSDNNYYFVSVTRL